MLGTENFVHAADVNVLSQNAELYCVNRRQLGSIIGDHSSKKLETMRKFKQSRRQIRQRQAWPRPLSNTRFLTPLGLFYKVIPTTLSVDTSAEEPDPEEGGLLRPRNEGPSDPFGGTYPLTLNKSLQ